MSAILELQEPHSNSEIRIHVHLPNVVQDADGAAMNNLVVVLTHEGIIIDVVDDSGEVVGTRAEEYLDDIVYDIC